MFHTLVVKVLILMHEWAAFNLIYTSPVQICYPSASSLEINLEKNRNIMFPIKGEHIRRVSFASKLFPKLKSSFALDISKIKTTDNFDGELFCGGRSKNKDLLSFFGFINDSCGPASFVQLPSFRRSLKKLTNLVEQELETIGAQEILLPTLVPQKLWKASGRLKRQENALENVFELTDNSGNELLLGPTFEESVTKLIADLESCNEYDLPLLIYQTSPKFRSELKPKFGLLRSNEFFMNDMYSFDANTENAIKTYELVTGVYNKILERLGLSCRRIQSDPGGIGGKFSHEYQLPVSSGEDTIIECNSCHESYNLEMFEAIKADTGDKSCNRCGSKDLSSLRALELGHTFLLSDIYSAPFKARYIKNGGGGRQNYEMGCYGLGLTRILGASVDKFSIIPKNDGRENFLQLRWPDNVEPYTMALVTPAKRSKQHQAGSTEFAEKFVNKILAATKNTDLIIEDRDKEGISQRVFRLQSLGIPNIITIGRKFLQEPVQLELLKLNSEKTHYEQNWYSEDQLIDLIKQLER